MEEHLKGNNDWEGIVKTDEQLYEIMDFKNCSGQEDKSVEDL